VKILRWVLSILGVIVASTSIGAAAPAPKIEQAVIVHFTYGSRDLKRLFALEEKLEAAITKANVGEYDGNDVATDGSDGYLYMYGPDADRLFEVVKPILQSTPFMSGATAKKRYGPAEAGIKESVVVINP
jgi:hypothetical protein